jgi:FkbM family methyltransferase
MPLRETLAGRLFLNVPWRLTELRHVPVVGPLLHSLSHSVLPLETRIWVRVRRGSAKGLWIRISPRFGRAVYNGSYEAIVQETLAKCLRPGMVFYDIGANVGLFTLIGARCVGTSGRVFAFEPDPEVCQELRENVERNELHNVEVVEAAVSSATGSADFVRADPKISPGMGIGKLTSSAGKEAKIRVRTVALNDFLSQAKPPSVIKCDVEGAEMAVLEGARGVLKRHRPIVVCEAHSEELATAVTKLLEEMGYRVLPLPPRSRDPSDERNHLLAAR